MAVYEKASGEYPMNTSFYGPPGIAVAGPLSGLCLARGGHRPRTRPHGLHRLWTGLVDSHRAACFGLADSGASFHLYHARSEKNASPLSGTFPGWRPTGTFYPGALNGSCGQTSGRSNFVRNDHYGFGNDHCGGVVALTENLRSRGNRPNCFCG